MEQLEDKFTQDRTDYKVQVEKLQKKCEEDKFSFESFLGQLERKLATSKRESRDLQKRISVLFEALERIVVDDFVGQMNPEKYDSPHKKLTGEEYEVGSASEDHLEEEVKTSGKKGASGRDLIPEKQLRKKKRKSISEQDLLGLVGRLEMKMVKLIEENMEQKEDLKNQGHRLDSVFEDLKCTEESRDSTVRQLQDQLERRKRKILKKCW